jgi:hypothetical protein
MGTRFRSHSRAGAIPNPHEFLRPCGTGTAGRLPPCCDRQWSCRQPPIPPRQALPCYDLLPAASTSSSPPAAGKPATTATRVEGPEGISTSSPKGIGRSEGTVPAEGVRGSKRTSTSTERIGSAAGITPAPAEGVGSAGQITSGTGGVGGAKRSVPSTGRPRRPKVIGAPPFLESAQRSGPPRFTSRELGVSEGTPLTGIPANRIGPFQPVRTAQIP